jgi:hypothetical protein
VGLEGPLKRQSLINKRENIWIFHCTSSRTPHV